MKNSESKVYIIRNNNVNAVCWPRDYQKYKEKGWAIAKHINNYSMPADNYGMALDICNRMNLGDYRY